MDIKNKLDELGLDINNSVVIGSGILNALGLRESSDIDVVVDPITYNRLSQNNRFKKVESHGKEVLVDDLFEIRTSWTVIGKAWNFEGLVSQSVTIDNVRYNNIQFLLDVKKSWVINGEARQKDIDDVEMIENYLRKLL